MCLKRRRKHTHLNDANTCPNHRDADGYLQKHREVSRVSHILQQVHFRLDGQSQHPEPVRLDDFDPARNDDIVTVRPRPANHSLGDSRTVGALLISQIGFEKSVDVYLARSVCRGEFVRQCTDESWRKRQDDLDVASVPSLG